MDDAFTDTLTSLHTAAIDARNGYDKALEDADSPKDLSGLFGGMRALHDRNAAELAGWLVKAGRKPDEDGSFMSTVHRVVMDVRSWFDGLGTSVLPGLIDGEKRNIAAYDDALAEAASPAEANAMLASLRARLASALAEMEQMKRAA